MDAAMIARVMSAVPERATWVHSGTAFAAHDGQGAQVRYLAQFLQWLSPLTVLAKDDLRALGLLTAHQKLAEQGAGPNAEDGLEPDEEGELEEETLDFDPDATLPPRPVPEEEKEVVLATTT